MMYANILITSLILCSVDSFKILGIFPHPGKSHHIVFEPLLLSLAERGHELTIISHFAPEKVPKGWTQISLKNFEFFHKEIFDLNDFDQGSFITAHVREFLLLKNLGHNMCELLTTTPELQDLVTKKAKFDVILTEQFVSDCGLIIANVIGGPVIGFQSHYMMPWHYERFNQPIDTSYIPNIFLGYAPTMNFFQRTANTVLTHIHLFLHKYFVINEDKAIIEKNLNISLPPVEDMINNISSMLCHTHYMINGVKPLVPGIYEVAGMFLKTENRSLNPEIEKILNESEHGVILFSLGSMIKAHTFSPIKLGYLFDIFKRLKQKIIWKLETDSIANLPDNVYTMKWVPQYEILHHPKTVAFIGHGGLGGVLEVLHAGKPSLFIPVYGDQNQNGNAAQENGLGVSITYKSITKNNLEDALDKILSPEYQQSASNLSTAWREMYEKTQPLKFAIEHVEYVARNGGLRRYGSASKLKWYQRNLLDVYLSLVILLSSLFFVVYKTIKIIISKITVSTTKHKIN